MPHLKRWANRPGVMLNREKASLVSLLGLAEARQMAEHLIEQAAGQLKPYGGAADELIALARFAIDRNH